LKTALSHQNSRPSSRDGAPCGVSAATGRIAWLCGPDPFYTAGRSNNVAQSNLVGDLEDLGPPAAPTSVKSMLKICLIDDDPLVRGALALGLEDGGYQVFAAETGQAGLALIERERLDVVMTDLRMPGMDGAALIGLIRTRHPDLPIIAMSGQAEAEQDDLCGADAFLRKPFKIRDVGAALAAARAKRQSGSANTH
jgi:CheY-like chemotaxis protein